MEVGDKEGQHYCLALRWLSLLPGLVARPKIRGMEDRKTYCVARERHAVQKRVGDLNKTEVGSESRRT